MPSYRTLAGRRQFLAGLGSANVQWQDGKPIDLTCPGREPVAFTSGNDPIWGYTSKSVWGAKPIMDPGRIPCGKPQTGMPGDRGILKKVVQAAAIGVGSVAAISLGSAALAKGAGVLKSAVGSVGGAGASGAATAAGSSATTAAGGAATAATGAASTAAIAEAAAQTGSLFSRIKENGNRILQFVNQGRTIHAIANGEIPPPPVSIKGDSFLEWAFNAAQDQMVKEQQRKLTRQEEELLQLEIMRMQRELDAVIPESMPKAPSPAVPAVVQRRQAEVVEQNRSNDELLKIAMIAGLPVLALLLTRG